MLLVVRSGAEPAISRKSPNAGQVVVELGREEAGTAHLAVAHHVDARVFLVPQGDIHRVVEHLRQVDRSEFTSLRAVEACNEP
jgi:hypothetical protein